MAACGDPAGSEPGPDGGPADATVRDGALADGATCGEAVPGRLVCNPDDLEYLYTVDACGNLLERDTRCFDPKVCEEDADGQAACRCALTGNLTCRASDGSFANSLYDDTYVVRERACASSRGEIDPADLVETCGFGTVCYVDDYEGEGHVPRNGGQAFCARSLSDDDSAYVDHGCDPAFDEYMRYPTTLEIDCRCRITSVSGSAANAGSASIPVDPTTQDPEAGNPKGPIMNCAQPGRVDSRPWPVAYGSGPVFSDYNDGASTWYGAEFDPAARELYAVVNWNDPEHTDISSIVAWNVDTKDRRVVSGLLPDSVSGVQAFGAGYESPTAFLVDAGGDTQPLTGVDAIRLGPDGNLYAASRHEILRVDPSSGTRELVWRRQEESVTGEISATYGQCLRPSHLGVADGLQLESASFAVGPDLAFYRGFRDVRGGSGVLRVAPDGGTCEVIARWNGQGDSAPDPVDSVPPPADVGTGYLPNPITTPVQGMLVHAGRLYFVASGDLVALELASGARTRVDDSDLPYPAGYTAMQWDPEREVIWTAGASAAIFGNVIVDPVTGQKERIVSDTGRQDYPGMAILDSVYPGGGSAANTGGGATSNNNHTQFGGVVVDPLDSDIVYGVTVVGGLIQLELSTFNNYIRSWGQH
ncbi:MAG: hypothetical protein CMN30_13530 [Sandaracinus sp.]|nr:hypothetical protein [Sandaracinus sp.]